MMRYLESYDKWCIEKVAACLDFVEEWLGISRLTFKRLVLGLFVLLLPFLSKDLLDLCLGAGVTVLLWTNLESRAVNGGLAYLKGAVLAARLVSQATSLLSALTLTRPTAHNIWSLVQNLCFTFLLYSIVSGDDDGHGKRRKLAFDGLKRLFGTSWIVTPEAKPV